MELLILPGEGEGYRTVKTFSPYGLLPAHELLPDEIPHLVLV